MWEQNWRKKNKSNYTTCSLVNIPNHIDINTIVSVGKGTYGNIDLRWFWNKEEHLEIGCYCSIAEGVMFLIGGNHSLNTLSSFPFNHYYDTGYSSVAPTKGPIVVRDDVWIGQNALILSGVTIGQGAVIGAGSVVAKDVPPYAIFVGNRVVKYRFPAEYITKLVQFDYSLLDEADIKENGSILNYPIDDSFFESKFYLSHIRK